ncbi:MAG TPA: phosphoribosyltransferase [Bryobacteraceae bacterium]|nr:phosphoribosyltransferase [Bryobacteraceae bacterium]
MQFLDRADAGRHLGEALKARYGNRPDVLVLGLPRGGVPVAYEVSKILIAPLDVFVVRKLGVPGHEELAMGAIASGGAVVLNDDVVRSLAIAQSTLDHVIERESRELERRERLYRGDRPLPPLAGVNVVLVDDGLATGASMHAAVEALRTQRPATIAVAVPVGAASTCGRIRRIADDVVCLTTPEPFYAVSAWYDDFSQTSDDEVFDVLMRATREDSALTHER